MPKGWKKFVCLSPVFILATAVLSAAAVRPAAAKKAAFPTGKFGNAGWKLDFKADGTYRASGPPGRETGTYAVTGSRVVITCQCCGPVPGSYSWQVDGRVLTFQAIEDACTNRLDVLACGPWLKTP
jgi:hypothetical protein